MAALGQQTPCSDSAALHRRYLRECFATAVAHVVIFANPLTGGFAANTVYVAGVAG